MSLLLTGVGGAEQAVILYPDDPRLGTLYRAHDVNDITTLWTDAGITQVMLNNDVIGRWGDKSGNGNHLNQTTSSAKPLYKVSQDGTPGIKFDEVDDFLLQAVAVPANYEIYLIFHQTRTSFPGPVNNADPIITSGAAGSMELTDYSGFVSTASARLSSGASTLTNTWVNGAATALPLLVASNQTWVVSGTTGTYASNLGHYIAKASNNTHFSPDALKGIFMYTTTHDDVQRALFHTWAMTLGGYGI